MKDIDQSVRDHLEARYPGISNDAIGYQFERKPNGELHLHVDLVLNDRKLRERELINHG